MKRVDLWLDKPIELIGKDGVSYGDIIHIDTTTEGDEYIEREPDEYQVNDILYLDEMECDEDRAKVEEIINNNPEL